MPWQNTQTITSRSFTCGYCSNVVASALGYYTNKNNLDRVYICPHCDKPTYFGEKQVPGVAPGVAVANLPTDIEALYKEARNCVAIGSYTSAVLTCRKLLMNIAVSQKAAPGESFISYVEYLADNGFVPPNGKGWVDHIRTKGNEANHEIALMKKEDAEELISFSEMLLKFIYEFPARVPKTKP
jgi:hypothetical protein